MANFRNITQVEEITSLSDGDKLVVNANGVAKLYDANTFFSDQIESLNTVTNELNNLEATKQDKLPEITADDAGKFLRVAEDGTWYISEIIFAEEVPL